MEKNWSVQAVYDGYTTEDGTVISPSKSQTEFFTVIASSISSPSKTPTNLILDPLPTTFKAKGSDSRADVTFSGELETADKKFYITGSLITLKFTGFTYEEKYNYEVTTDDDGKFNEVFTLPPGKGYGVQAVFEGGESPSGKIWAPTKSQTEFFTVISSSQSSTSGIGGPTFLN